MKRFGRREFMGGMGAGVAGVAFFGGAKTVRRFVGTDGPHLPLRVPTGLSGAAGIEQGGIEEDVVFPAETFAASVDGVGVMNVQTLFGAKGDGVTDDTQALIQAYDTVLARYRALGSVPAADQNIIYLPSGTYLVSDTIVYSLPLVIDSHGDEVLARIRFQGQSETGVTIKLADRATGFEAGANKPVLSLAKGAQNGSVASNYVQDLTIDTGSGNPGAVGLVFEGANNAAVRRVSIRSGDGTGAIGLSLPVEVTQGSYEDLTIAGFDYALSAGPSRAFSVALEDVRISGQRVAGIQVVDACVSVRGLVSSNSVPAAQVTGPDGQLVMVDSFLGGGSAGVAAIEVQAGELFARNIGTQGYGSAITDAGGVVVPSSHVEEYVSAPVAMLFGGQAPRSLDLPVEQMPRMPWPADLSKWVSVNAFGAVGDGVTDDSAAIQAAMDSGYPVVYFLPDHEYLIGATVTIPSSVSRVNFMYVNVFPATGMASGDAMFKLGGERDDEALMLEDLFGWFGGDELNPLVDHASTRTLMMQDVHHQHAPIYRNSVPGAKVFLDVVSCRTADVAPAIGLPGFVFSGQDVWVRFCDPEYGNPNLVNHGSTLWMLAGKTEGPWTSFATEAGGQTEILGAVINVFTGGFTISASTPIVSNDDSAVSATLASYGFNAYFETIVTETRGSVSKSLPYSEVPRRLNTVQSFLPLYVGVSPGTDKRPPALKGRSRHDA